MMICQVESGEITHKSEPMDLEAASPATVSCCRQPRVLGWRPMVRRWIEELPAAFNVHHKRLLGDMFERFVDPCLSLLRKHLNELSPTSDTNVVINMMNILECMTDEFANPEVLANISMSDTITWIESSFFFALSWSVCATGTAVVREKLKHMTKEEMSDDAIVPVSLTSEPSDAKSILKSSSHATNICPRSITWIPDKIIYLESNDVVAFYFLNSSKTVSFLHRIILVAKRYAVVFTARC